MSLLHPWVLGGQQVTTVDLGRAGAGGCRHRPLTGNQLERFVRAHRTLTHADDAAARVRRQLAATGEPAKKPAATRNRLKPPDPRVPACSVRSVNSTGCS
jgi:hypothetical protein